MGIASKRYRVRLAKAIEEVCMLGPGGKYTRGITSYPAYKIINIITKTIAKGLERDGFITIEGFGRFEVRRYKPYHKLVAQGYVNEKGKHAFMERRLEFVHPKSKVIFKPCKSLYESLIERDKDE